MTSSKVCKGCLRDLPLASFWAFSSGKDGLHTRCKDCCAKARKEYPSLLARKDASQQRLLAREALVEAGKVPNPSSQTCLDCLEVKTENDFYRHARTGLYDVCRICIVAGNHLRQHDPEAYATLKAQRKLRRKTVNAPDHKVCAQCTKDLPLGAFRIKSKGLYGHSTWCQECERAYNKERRQGPERERVLEERRRAWVANPSSEEQKAKAATKARAWYANNKVRHKETLKAWVSANREAVNTISARRRARKAAVTNDFTLEQWEEILEYFNHACAYCLQANVQLAMDHMDPIVRGGPHTQSNIIPSCKACNSKKGPRSIFKMV